MKMLARAALLLSAVLLVAPASASKQAYIIATFYDSGTAARYAAGSIVTLDDGTFANYKAAGLVRDPTDGDVAVGATWTDGSVAKDMRSYARAELQVSGLAAGDTVVITRSLTGDAYAQQSWVNNAFISGDTISVDGIYSFSGGAFFKYAKMGSGSAPTVVIRGGS